MIASDWSRRPPITRHGLPPTLWPVIMDPRARHHGPSAPASLRRLSGGVTRWREDMFYNHVMTAPQRRPSQPPPYRRAEDRHWHPVFVVLQGTAPQHIRRQEGLGDGARPGRATISPDNPPWMRKGKLEKTYSLLHSRRRQSPPTIPSVAYVIRLRAETDQFLLSCVELSTFVKWLECLFAAIDIAAPIDDLIFTIDGRILAGREVDKGRHHDTLCPLHRAYSVPTAGPVRDASGGPPRIGPPRRFSMTNYPNLSVDPHTGKWFPEHKWSSAHDLLYAKLCYATYFSGARASPTTSSARASSGLSIGGPDGWSGFLPPTYGEVDYFGPWQVIHTENFRI
ncbi:hypothetical protein G6O67_003962 [Ophiocordyceps sinensis]|uniref:PH domain-containing protein n=1 Tax=Ophiocordyceps sinensis TaxID=72228 RepID=A0A8H4LYE2_9HYPO|nr:hypothetical protein G6O67_003962 [Ophiocordyceps sinensis]